MISMSRASRAFYLLSNNSQGPVFMYDGANASNKTKNVYDITQHVDKWDLGILGSLPPIQLFMSRKKSVLALDIS